ncbi:MAG TPA: hemolysin family protein [Stenomitos sp.]
MDLSGLLGKLFGVVALILFNAFFVAAEFSFVSVRRTRIDQLVEEGNSTAKLVRKAMDEPTRFISTTQLGITLASLGLGWIGEPTLSEILEPLFKSLGPLTGAATNTLSVILSFAIISYLLMVLGELAPKTLGLHQAEKVILMVAWPIEWFYFLFRPFIWLLNRSSSVLLGWFGLRVSKAAHLVHSEEELKMLVQASHEGGVLEAEEQALLNKAFEFSDKTVDEVMVPRPDMKCLPAEASFEEILQLAAESHHTRLPVYEENVDHIIGFVHVKDLLTRLKEGSGLIARDLVRPILAVPENKSIADLLTDFRRQHTPVAIVIDEFGGTAGMVTSEDCIEELVGELADEFQEETGPEIERQPDGSVLLDGRVAIDEINERFGLDLPSEEFNTIAGLVFGEIGHTPEVGDEVRVGDMCFRVEATNGRRATLIRMIPSPPAPPEEPTPEPTPE